MAMTADPSGARTVVPGRRRRTGADWDVRTGVRLETARQWLDSGGSVLIHGPCETTTSAALDVVTRCRLERVLRCQARTAERRRGYAVLGRLLDSVSGSDLRLVRRIRQGVLIAVLAGQAGKVSPAAVRLAVLDLLRQVALQRPVLLVVDRVQDIDPDSADVLRYLVTRVQDSPVRLAAAEYTPGAALPRHRQLCPSPLLLVRLSGTSPSRSRIPLAGR